MAQVISVQVHVTPATGNPMSSTGLCRNTHTRGTCLPTYTYVGIQNTSSCAPFREHSAFESVPLFWAGLKHNTAVAYDMTFQKCGHPVERNPKVSFVWGVDTTKEIITYINPISIILFFHIYFVGLCC